MGPIERTSFDGVIAPTVLGVSLGCMWAVPAAGVARESEWRTCQDVLCKCGLPITLGYPTRAHVRRPPLHLVLSVVIPAIRWLLHKGILEVWGDSWEVGRGTRVLLKALHTHCL
jgi:hypothetical protein